MPWRRSLEMAAALGARRGEVLALRWWDTQNGRVTIARSLTQTKQVLKFKGTKTERPRVVKVPESTLVTIEAHASTRMNSVASSGQTIEQRSSPTQTARR